MKVKPHFQAWKAVKPWGFPKVNSSYRNKRCGKDCWNRGDWPAIGGNCYKCWKHGHFNSQYFTRCVSVVESESVLESAFLGVVESTNRKGWFLDICLEEKRTSFKLDAGAKLNAISEEMLKTLPNTTFQKPTKHLYQNHKPLQGIRQFQCSLSRVKGIYVSDWLSLTDEGFRAETSNCYYF